MGTIPMDVPEPADVIGGDGVALGFPWWAVWFLAGSGAVAWVLFAPPRKRSRKQ